LHPHKTGGVDLSDAPKKSVSAFEKAAIKRGVECIGSMRLPTQAALTKPPPKKSPPVRCVKRVFEASVNLSGFKDCSLSGNVIGPFRRSIV
jgi:hypothetical protein